MITKLSGCKRRGEKRRETMQVVRAMLAARELTRITSQSCKKKTITSCLWWRGWRTKMITSVVLLTIKGDAYTNECDCPPSSTTCSSPQKLPVQCYCAEESYLGSRTEKTCLQWQINALEPLMYSTTLKSLGKAYITDSRKVDVTGPTLLSQGYCPLKLPLPSRKVHLGYIAGLATNYTVDQVYAHPHFGLVGVNTTNHAQARFGKDAIYKSNYSFYEQDCHYFAEIVAPTAYGWTRLFDDFTLWVGFKERANLDIYNILSPELTEPRKWAYRHKYQLTRRKAPDGGDITTMKEPRPSEVLVFDRQLDHRKLTAINAMERWQKGVRDFAWMPASQVRNVLKHSYENKIESRVKAINWTQPRNELPRYVKSITQRVTSYLGKYATVSMTCSYQIKNTTLKKLTLYDHYIEIPYVLTGYAKSMTKVGPWFGWAAGSSLRCDFTPGSSRPTSTGPPFLWIHQDKPISLTAWQLKEYTTVNREDHTPLKLTTIVSHGNYTHLREMGGSQINPNAVTISTGGAHDINEYPVMWGKNCPEKQTTAKCNKTMVDLETKIRYNKSFYDPYQNRSIIPDSNQNAIFFPPHDAGRDKRQVFAAIAIVTAFAVQGAVDYAGYEGIQGIEQELNDEMNTRADRNNVRFRQADSAIGRLSGQIQDLNAKVAQLSEEDATTVELLLSNVKTQAQENILLQQQIEKNNRVLVDLSRAHLREATANRQMDDAATFLLKTVVSVLNQSKPFLQQDIGYNWQLNNGLIHLQGVEKQLINVLGTNGNETYQDLINETCERFAAEIQQQNHLEAERKLQQDIETHLAKIRNETKLINATAPEPIVIHYAPELNNLSRHNSGEIMKKAFEKVITHPIKTVEKVGKEAIGLVTKILGHPLKIPLTIAIVAILVVILVALAKKLIERKSDATETSN